MAHLINGGLVDAALWGAHHLKKDVALEQALASLNLLLDGLRSTPVYVLLTAAAPFRRRLKGE